MPRHFALAVLVSFICACSGTDFGGGSTKMSGHTKDDEEAPPDSTADGGADGPSDGGSPSPTPSASPAGESTDGDEGDDDLTVDEELVKGVPKLKPYGTCSSPCAGEVRKFYNAAFDKHIAVVLCSPSRYDIFMANQEDGPYYKVGDSAGHGQDHCQLLNPTFTMPNEDDITSGSCTSCAAASAGRVTNITYGNVKAGDSPMFYRARFNDGFGFATEAKQIPNLDTSCWYECNVTYE